MDIKNISRDFGNSVENSYINFTSRIRNFKYQKEVAVGLLVVLVSIGIFLTYRWYTIRYNRTAQVKLSSIMMDYDSRLHNNSEDWSSFVEQVQKEYKTIEKSVYAPYFLLFEVDALSTQNKKDEALAVMEKALIQLEKSALGNLFSTKYALMLVDTSDSDMQEKGRQILIKNAQDSANIYRDYALYYLGRYYLLHNQKSEAKIAWQELIESQRIEQVAASPWAQLAEQQMAQLI